MLGKLDFFFFLTMGGGGERDTKSWKIIIIIFPRDKNKREI